MTNHVSWFDSRPRWRENIIPRIPFTTVQSNSNITSTTANVLWIHICTGWRLHFWTVNKLQLLGVENKFSLMPVSVAVLPVGPSQPMVWVHTQISRTGQQMSEKIHGCIFSPHIWSGWCSESHRHKNASENTQLNTVSVFDIGTLENHGSIVHTWLIITICFSVHCKHHETKINYFQLTLIKTSDCGFNATTMRRRWKRM